MTRLLYAIAWACAVPLVLARLYWRGRTQHGYRLHVAERFGRHAPAPEGPRIWVHAVSLGETRAAAPVVAALAARFPGHRILVTHMTPTGRAAGEELFGDRVERAWLPYDLAFAARRFVRHYRPAFGVILETELWPRLLEECRAAGTPVVLANARLSERSARRYARFPAFARWALGNLAGIAAQTPADAARFAALGAPPPAVTGNVKFDLEVPPEAEARGRELRALLGEARPVWVAGSTREGEEALLLDAFAAADPRALLVIVPRHPQRFDEVVRLAAARNLEPSRRSDAAAVPASTRVVVGDTMGEMLTYYAAADVVLMGGSFLDYGSQNLIEPCALGKPVIVGPSTFNFEQAADGAIAAGEALRVGDAAAAMAAAARIDADAGLRARMGTAGRDFVLAHRGAVARLMAWLEATPGIGAAASRDPTRG
jgi:3-deoxy-D-manno-octulosonic-acid transferase